MSEIIRDMVFLIVLWAIISNTRIQIQFTHEFVDEVEQTNKE